MAALAPAMVAAPVALAAWALAALKLAEAALVLAPLVAMSVEARHAVLHDAGPAPLHVLLTLLLENTHNANDDEKKKGSDDDDEGSEWCWSAPLTPKAMAALKCLDGLLLSPSSSLTQLHAQLKDLDGVTKRLASLSSSGLTP